MNRPVPDEYLEPGPAPPVPGPYLRLSTDWLDDPHLCSIVPAIGPMAFLWWAVLLTEAKNARDFGRVTVGGAALAKTLGDVSLSDQADQALQAFVDAGLIDAVRKGAAWAVTIRNWRAWQTMTNAEKQKVHRARNRDHESNGVTKEVTALPETSQRYPTKTKTEEENDAVLARVPAHDASALAREAGEVPATDWTTAIQPTIELLDCITNGGDEGIRRDLSQQIRMHHRRYRHPVDAYHRAAQAAADRIAGGFWPDRGTPTGWYLSTVRYHLHAIDRPTPDQKAETSGSQYTFLD